MLITRRELMKGVVTSVVVVPIAAQAQQAGKTYRIGFLSDAVQVGPVLPKYLDAFRQGLREHGWLEGQNVVVDFREARTVEQRSEIVAALLQAKPDVIVAMDGAIALIHPAPRRPLPGWRPVRDIPIVFTGLSDPVGMGLVQSLTHPGGNMTGLSYLGVELNAKRLALLKEMLPRLARVLILVPADHVLRDKMIADIDAVARGLDITLQRVEVASSDPVEKIDTAIEAALKQRPEAMLGLQGPHYFRERKRICDLALKHRLPGAFEVAEYATAGCLMAYATSLADLVRRAAGYVDKILKGAKPADLPIEQPTKFELVINLKTAKALGLTIPPSLLLRADRFIE